MEIGKLYKFYGQYENTETLVGIFDGIDSTTGFVKFKDVCLAKYCDKSQPTIEHVCYELNAQHWDNHLKHMEEAKKIVDEWASTDKAPKEAIFHKEVQYSLDNTRLFIPMKSYFEEV